MNFASMKGYMLTLASALVILASIILIVMNWGNPFELSLYWKIFKGNSLGLLMLLSAVSGIIIWWSFRLLIAGVRSLRKGRMQQTLHRVINQPAKE